MEHLIIRQSLPTKYSLKHRYLDLNQAASLLSLTDKITEWKMSLF